MVPVALWMVGLKGFNSGQRGQGESWTQVVVGAGGKGAEAWLFQGLEAQVRDSW